MKNVYRQKPVRTRWRKHVYVLPKADGTLVKTLGEKFSWSAEEIRSRSSFPLLLS